MSLNAPITSALSSENQSLDRSFVWGRRLLIATGLFPAGVALFSLIRFHRPLFDFYGTALFGASISAVEVSAVATNRALFFSNMLMLLANLFANGMGSAFLAWYALKPGARTVWWFKCVVATFLGLVDAFATSVLFLDVGWGLPLTFVPLVSLWIGLLLTRRGAFART